MATEILVPELGESVVEATVGRWLKQEGDPVKVGEILVELETDKVNLEVSASRPGVLARIDRQEGEDVRIGDVLGIIQEGEGESGERAEKPVEAKKAEADKPKEAPHEERVTPVARRLAGEKGIDVSKVQGTGAGGRVTRQDVERAIAEKSAGAEEAGPEAERAPEPGDRPAPVSEPEPKPQAQADGREEVIRMSRRRRTIAKRLVEAQHTAAMLTTFNEIDMSAVIDIRSRRRESFEKRHGVRLGFMSFFVKATVGALKAFPRVNAEIRDDHFIIKHHYDIGIAIGDEEGLVVPVLRDAGAMSFADIEKTIKTFVDKAGTGALSIEDLRGGTFTITNGGVFGSLLSTPILNPPQVGILGMHKIEDRPVALNGQVVIRPMMYVALSYDHRIIDGREAVQFLVRVKELIEDPTELLLEG